MTTKTHVLGKDAALEDTLQTARALLHQHGFPIELVSSKHPVQNCWSVHLRSSECPQIYTTGKGSSELASEASALYEFFERLSTNLFFFDYYLGNNTAEADFVFYPNEKWFPNSHESLCEQRHGRRQHAHRMPSTGLGGNSGTIREKQCHRHGTLPAHGASRNTRPNPPAYKKTSKSSGRTDFPSWLKTRLWAVNFQ